jgi:hypothetical protein
LPNVDLRTFFSGEQSSQLYVVFTGDELSALFADHDAGGVGVARSAHTPPNCPPPYLAPLQLCAAAMQTATTLQSFEPL